MEHRAAFVVLALFFFVSVPVAAQAPPAGAKDGPLAFMQGMASFYAGDHVGAQKAFAAYEKAHPQDLLAASRALYDRWLVDRAERKGGKLASGEYRKLLRATDDEITAYEAHGCSGTDLEAIAGDTLDCASKLGRTERL
jgi:hypothetical protein